MLRYTCTSVAIPLLGRTIQPVRRTKEFQSISYYFHVLSMTPYSLLSFLIDDLLPECTLWNNFFSSLRKIQYISSIGKERNLFYLFHISFLVRIWRPNLLSSQSSQLCFDPPWMALFTKISVAKATPSEFLSLETLRRLMGRDMHLMYLFKSLIHTPMKLSPTAWPVLVIYHNLLSLVTYMEVTAVTNRHPGKANVTSFLYG